MRIKKRIVLPMALAMSAVTMLAIASLGNATHSVPLNASPVKVSLVPVYNNCPGTGGLSHGTPLAAPSCRAGPDRDRSTDCGTKPQRHVGGQRYAERVAGCSGSA